MSHVGPPSAPVLTVVPTNYQTFNFIISPLSEPSDCVLSYSITPTTSDGSVLADITVEPPDSGDSIRVTMSGFDVCNTAYTFTVVANTLNGPGETSSSVAASKLQSMGSSSCIITIFWPSFINIAGCSYWPGKSCMCIPSNLLQITNITYRRRVGSTKS